MKKDLKKDIKEVLLLLAERDPDWAQPRMVLKFKWLFQAWAASELRHGRHSQPYFSKMWKRGWLAIQDWRRFKKYALQ